MSDSPGLGGRGVVAVRRSHGDVKACRRSTRATHTHSVLVLCLAGRSRVEQDGEWTLGPGDALLVPAGAPHRTLEAQGAEQWGVSFSAPFLAASSLEAFERVRDGASAVVKIPAGRQEFLEGLVGELERVTREPRPGLEAIQRSLLTLILAEVDAAAGAGAATSIRAGSLVGDALRFIERRCLGPLTLEEVAAAVGRSPTHVTAALTKATGRSAVKWIVSLRLAEARRLLLHSDERVERVAERVGYADATHFIRMFRREHGLTPAAWRARHVGA